MAGSGFDLLTQAGRLQASLQLLGEEDVRQLALPIASPVTGGAPQSKRRQIQHPAMRWVWVVQVLSVHRRAALLRGPRGDLCDGHIAILLSGGFHEGPQASRHQEVAQVVRLDLNVVAILGHLNIQSHDPGVVAHNIQSLKLLFELVRERADTGKVTVVHLHDRNGLGSHTEFFQLSLNICLHCLALLRVSHRDHALCSFRGQGFGRVETQTRRG
mmetsp:Transcript_23316/g.37959  ORF Transcript_23316/g.37959 Transcript_23316/m.37959 type:complete len:215 (-) Transcript_23316:184-828(-)